MKKIIYILILVLLTTTVLAQDIRISVIEYNPDKSSSARIMIRNHDTEIHRDVRYKVGDGEENFIVGVLGPGEGVGTTIDVSPGDHTITAITDKGTFQNDVVFQDSTESKEIKREVLRDEIRAQLEKEEKEERFKKGFPYIILVIIAIIAYLLYRHFKK